MGSPSPQSANPDELFEEMREIGEELTRIVARIRRLSQRQRASMRELADWCRAEGIPVEREITPNGRKANRER